MNTTASLLSKPAVTPRELCLLLQSGQQATYKAIASGSIPSFRIGNSLRIPTSWLRQQLQISDKEVA
jgi:excisionase family DNA binding protein